jgi:hypothetical protein
VDHIRETIDAKRALKAGLHSDRIDRSITDHCDAGAYRAVDRAGSFPQPGGGGYHQFDGPVSARIEPEIPLLQRIFLPLVTR